MANIGLYIELKNGVFKKSNRELLTLARQGRPAACMPSFFAPTCSPTWRS